MLRRFLHDSRAYTAAFLCSPEPGPSFACITLVTLSGDLLARHTSVFPMKTVMLIVLLMIGVAHASTSEEKNVLVMDGEDGGLWRGFETNKACLGLRAIKLSDRETFRWSLAVAGSGRGSFEVLLIEMPTKRNLFFGTNISKGVSRACSTIKEEIKRSK